jgi:hypothetical protein
MEKQLTSVQVESLFVFVRSKYVRYRDVQYEIVDHLASAIEHEQSQNPDLSFDAALRRVYGRFPITGFSQMVEEKENALTAYWRSRIWKSMLSYFTWPRLMMTLTLFLICVSAIQWMTYSILFLLFTILMYMFYSMYITDLEIRNSRDLEKNYLFFSTFKIANQLPIWSGLILPRFMDENILDLPDNLHMGKIIVFSIVLTLLFIYTHAHIHIFPKMLKEEVQHKYQHLGIQL